MYVHVLLILTVLFLDHCKKDLSLNENQGLRPVSNNPPIKTPQKLIFLRQPSQTQAGQPILPAIFIELQNDQDKKVVNNGIQVSLSVFKANQKIMDLDPQSLDPQEALYIFKNITLTKADQFVLVASTSGIEEVKSVPFTITAAAPDHIRILTQPQSIKPYTPQKAMQVQIEDAFGNVIKNPSNKIRMQVLAQGEFTPAQEQTITSDSQGVFTFSPLSFTRAQNNAAFRFQLINQAPAESSRTIEQISQSFEVSNFNKKILELRVEDINHRLIFPIDQITGEEISTNPLLQSQSNPSTIDNGRYWIFSTFNALTKQDTDPKSVDNYNFPKNSDIYLYDREKHEFKLISIDYEGQNSGNGQSGLFGKNALFKTKDNRLFALFSSTARNLVKDQDSHPGLHLFLRDITAEKTYVISKDYQGNLADNAYNMDPSAAISDDYLYVSFSSSAKDMAGKNTLTTSMQTYVRKIPLSDLESIGEIFPISIDTRGRYANQGSFGSCISSDARYVTFLSLSSDLVDPSMFRVVPKYDLFIRDLKTQNTSMLSMNDFGYLQEESSGLNLNACQIAQAQADGLTLAFASTCGDCIDIPKTNKDKVYSGMDVFLRTFDISFKNQKTRLVSTDTYQSKLIGDYSSLLAQSKDGRFVAFYSSNITSNNQVKIKTVLMDTKTNRQAIVDEEENDLLAPAPIPERLFFFSDKADKIFYTQLTQKNAPKGQFIELENPFLDATY